MQHLYTLKLQTQEISATDTVKIKQSPCQQITMILCPSDFQLLDSPVQPIG